MSELETRIRDALRADEIGWDDLREPALRTDTPRSPRRWPAVLATAAAVAVGATPAFIFPHNFTASTSRIGIFSRGCTETRAKSSSENPSSRSTWCSRARRKSRLRRLHMATDRGDRPAFDD